MDFQSRSGSPQSICCPQMFYSFPNIPMSINGWYSDSKYLTFRVAFPLVKAVTAISHDTVVTCYSGGTVSESHGIPTHH